MLDFLSSSCLVRTVIDILANTRLTCLVPAGTSLKSDDIIYQACPAHSSPPTFYPHFYLQIADTCAELCLRLVIISRIWTRRRPALSLTRTMRTVPPDQAKVVPPVLVLTPWRIMAGCEFILFPDVVIIVNHPMHYIVLGQAGQSPFSLCCEPWSQSTTSLCLSPSSYAYPLFSSMGNSSNGATLSTSEI
jgi:hypothetical protein